MIRVIIERQIAEDLEQPYQQAVRQMIQYTVRVPGFLSGETFRDIRNPRHRYVISNWRSLEDFERWWHSADRKRMMMDLQPFLDGPEKVHILEHA